MSAHPYNINKRPYDSSAEERIPMYDKLPYKSNPEVCNKEHIRLISGNVIKFFNYNLDMDTIKAIPVKEII